MLHAAWGTNIIRKMVEILVVIPDKELESAYSKVISRMKVKEVCFSTAYIYGTDKSVLEKAEGFDIVVVRGMTFRAIRKAYPEIHVIEIGMTSSDIFDALLEVSKRYGREKVGLILSDRSICCDETISKLSGFEISVETINDENDIPQAADRLMESGCKVLIGGFTASSYALKKGYPYVPIGTGMASIEKSIQDALGAAQIIDRERTRASLMKTIVDSLPNALLVINSFGNIIAANQNAEAFFDSDTLVGRSGSSVWPDMIKPALLDDLGEMDIVQTVNGHAMLVSYMPFNENAGSRGFMVSLQKVDQFYATEKKVRSKMSEKGLVAKYHFSDIVADHLEMRKLIAKAIRYAQVEGNVLLTGETGTGKELFVQSMHNASARASGPFVSVNCAAIPEQLLESELFGYAEGAFTGAKKNGKMGLFELAHGGTLFLDEIGELPMPLQAKLLRVLQEGEVRRVGGDDVVSVDVRVMSATNQDIPKLIEKGQFRRDLYYRINLLSLHIPPLRERGGDLGLLFRHFVKLNAQKMHVPVPIVSQDAISSLQRYSWKGNIRELRNVAERIVVLNGSQRISAKTIEDADIPESEMLENDIPSFLSSSYANCTKTYLKNVSDEKLYEMYCSSKLSLSDFSQQVGISRTTLWRKFKKKRDA